METHDTASTAARTAMAINPAITACNTVPDVGTLCLTLRPLLVASAGSCEASAVPVQMVFPHLSRGYFTEKVISSTTGGANDFVSFWTSSAFSLCCPGATPLNT